MALIFRCIKIGWVSICVMVLFAATYFYFIGNIDGMQIFLGYSMLMLSFPVGYGAVILAGIGYFALYQIAGGTVAEFMYLPLFWGVFFVAGYWQWFVVIPYLTARFKKRYGKNAKSA